MIGSCSIAYPSCSALAPLLLRPRPAAARRIHERGLSTGVICCFYLLGGYPLFYFVNWIFFYHDHAFCQVCPRPRPRPRPSPVTLDSARRAPPPTARTMPRLANGRAPMGPRLDSQETQRSPVRDAAAGLSPST